MDFQNNIQNQMPGPGGGNIPGNMPYRAPAVPQRENAMATASMITGIIGGLSIFLLPVYLPCFFAGISIVLALLSKGNRNKLSPYALAGMITSLCSVILNMAIMIACIFLFLKIPEYRQEFNRVYEQMYGESFDDTIKNSLGEP